MRKGLLTFAGAVLVVVAPLLFAAGAVIDTVEYALHGKGKY
jgi:hypothetical protein